MPNTLSTWLATIENFHPETIALGLERTKAVAEKLKLLNFPCPIITVAGTNGKGSCVAFLEAILTIAGYRTGAYTSPHLLRFQERARIQKQEITDELWVKAFTQVEQARGQVQLTYFEFTTLAALWLFQQAGVEVLILEVGLGGRLDAVNIIDPDIAVITTIALDHMDWLGNTRTAIAQEKAGIMRTNKPAVIGDFAPPETIYSTAKQMGAQLYTVNTDFSYQQKAGYWDWQSQKNHWQNLPLPNLPMQNAATALMAIELLQPRLKINREHIDQGLQTATLPGRFQQLTKPAPTILDVAHNPAAAELLAQRLQQTPCPGQTLAVVSILADKDIAETLRPLIPRVSHWYLAGLAMPRGTKPENLEKHLQAAGVVAYDTRATVTEAYKSAVSHCKNGDRILVFGSFHTVAEVMIQIETNNIEENSAWI